VGGNISLGICFHLSLKSQKVKIKRGSGGKEEGNHVNLISERNFFWRWKMTSVNYQLEKELYRDHSGVVRPCFQNLKHWDRLRTIKKKEGHQKITRSRSGFGGLMVRIMWGISKTARDQERVCVLKHGGEHPASIFEIKNRGEIKKEEGGGGKKNKSTLLKNSHS